MQLPRERRIVQILDRIHESCVRVWCLDTKESFLIYNAPHCYWDTGDLAVAVYDHYKKAYRLERPTNEIVVLYQDKKVD